ncbi:isochorismate synthase [Nocardiopsis ansamitocini]|uniref:isochorismate synthase n=1 Tax=Nocardiopsis ansamitocini TaxID=1670832 RepID=A0A9W6P270_9ACTN|nr:isochorismate synthase [Nocardiopsis ansamitocini]GLU45776.1 isochorismate synthase [Nocardiopsis ansamitocini]
MNSAIEPPLRLFVRTVALPDDRALIDHLPETAPLAWIRRGEGLVAWGEAARLRLSAETERTGRTRFATAAEWARTLLAGAEVTDDVNIAGTGPVVFGSFSFDGTGTDSTVVLPRVIVGRRAGRSWITTVNDRPGHPSDLLAGSGRRREIGALRWSGGALGDDAWRTAVGAAVDRIGTGGLEKVVLARDLVAEAPDPIDVRTLLDRLTGDYPDCYSYSVDGLVGATPELLVRRDGDTLESLVLAGTRPRGTDPDTDAALAAALLDSDKDLAEHAYATESLRLALGPLSARLTVSDQPEILRLANLQHLASAVRATLRPGVSALDAVAALHPTAAVGGTPTAAAMEAIAELEQMDRGRYAGPVGWLDGHGNGEWGIALRCAHVVGRSARLFAGCGIVAGSEPEAELAEAVTKFAAMRTALTD